MRKEKNGNREAALAHTTIYVNVDKVGQTPQKGMEIGHLFEGAYLFSYHFFTTHCAHLDQRCSCDSFFFFIPCILTKDVST